MRYLRANVNRMGHILRVLSRHALAHFLGRRLARWPRLARRLPAAELSGPERLRTVFEDLSGTFIKFGQMLALQPDIVTLEYCDALFDLLDRVPPFPYHQVEEIVRRELGAPPDEVFEAFERRPIAAASIAQVHVAYHDGRKLAVKVQRPTVEVDFAGDIRLMRAAIRAIRLLRVSRLYWLIEPMSEFVNWTQEELDFLHEARYMERLRLNARDNAAERVPAVVWPLTTSRILVAEFLEGASVLDYLRVREGGDELAERRLGLAGFDRRRFSGRVIDNFLGDAFRHGIFHADLHPANLMILPGDVVGYVDFGITGVLSVYSRRHLVAMTLAYTRGDLEGMSDSFFRVSALGPNADREAFDRGLERLALGWYDGDGERPRLRKNFTLVMLDMLILSRDTDIWPERDVIKYIRSAIAIDGLITRLEPGFDVGRHLEEVCDRYLKWEDRRALVSPERLLASGSASGRLLYDGGARAMTMLNRLAAGEMPVRVRTDEPSDGRDLRTRALQLAGIAAGAALLAATTGGATLGLNLLTAELILAAAATVMLIPTIWRLVS